jgi:hypothetical protein
LTGREQRNLFSFLLVASFYRRYLGEMMMNRMTLQQVETSERFFRIPKALFTYDFYKPMTLAAKTAYAILKDRFELSVQNGWADEQGAVFLLYTVSQLGEILGCKKDKVIQIKKELNRYGLLEEERQGLNKPNRLYIGNIDVTPKVIHSDKASDTKEVGKTDYRNAENPTSRKRKNRLQKVGKTEPNDTDFSETERSETNNDEEEHASETQLIALAKEHIDEVLTTNPNIAPTLKLVKDLLKSEPMQAKEVVDAIDTEYRHLCLLQEQGNEVLTVAKILDGDRAIIKLLTKCVGQQLNFMRDHLTDHRLFGVYFAQGLKGRILTQVTTQQYFD